MNPGVSDALAVAGLQAALRRSGRLPAGAKWVEPTSLHLTVVFLGGVKRERIPALCEVAGEVVSARTVPEVVLNGMGCFPAVRPARVVWIGVRRTAGLIGLQSALARRLAPLVPGTSLQEGYYPHVTIARFARGTGPTDSQRLLADLRELWQSCRAEASEPVVWRQPTLALMLSEPGGGQARYSLLETFSFARSKESPSL